MFHQGTCSKDKALNEAHMNHMELQQELAKNESNPSSSSWIKKTQHLQDEELAITQELEVSKVVVS